MRELASNQTVKSQHVSGDITAPWTRINLSFASLKPCGLAGHFAYNNPQFEDIFVAREKDLGQGARIFTKVFSWFLYI